MKRCVVCLLLCLLALAGTACSPLPSTGQTLCISEMQSAGGTEDWIELYNYGTEPVSLQGWYLSDDPASPGKSPLPAVTLKPSERLVVSTAGTDCPLQFRLSAKGETVVLTNPTGTAVQTVSLPASVPGVSYGCVETDIFSPTQFVWYAAPTPGISNETGMMLGSNATNTAYGVRINEYVLRNRTTLYDEDGDYGDWVELYNASETAVDLAGWSLTDDETDTVRWQFPENTVLPAHSFLIVFCDNKNKTTPTGELHTNFSLSRSDRFIGLYTADGSFCSGVTCESADTDCAFGCDETGAVGPCQYATPGYANAPASQEERS